MTDRTYIGIDLASGKGSAVLVEYRDGVANVVRELDLDNPDGWAGLQVDGVWCEELDRLA